MACQVNRWQPTAEAREAAGISSRRRGDADKTEESGSLSKSSSACPASATRRRWQRITSRVFPAYPGLRGEPSARHGRVIDGLPTRLMSKIRKAACRGKVLKSYWGYSP